MCTMYTFNFTLYAYVYIAHVNDCRLIKLANRETLLLSTLVELCTE